MENATFDVEYLERCISSLGEKFIKSPYDFFTESDAHAFLYHTILNSGDSPLTALCPTCNSANETVLVHREYPTIFKYKKKDMRKPEKEGTRGHYDLVILNPKFVEEHTIDEVIAKDLKSTVLEGEDVVAKYRHHLVAAIEFKFITRALDKGMKQQIEEDIVKLKWALGYCHCQNAYLLVLNRYGCEDQYIEELGKRWKDDEEVKILYIESTICKEKNKPPVEYFGSWNESVLIPNSELHV